MKYSTLMSLGKKTLYCDREQSLVNGKKSNSHSYNRNIALRVGGWLGRGHHCNIKGKSGGVEVASSCRTFVKLIK